MQLRSVVCTTVEVAEGVAFLGVVLGLDLVSMACERSAKLERGINLAFTGLGHALELASTAWDIINLDGTEENGQ